MRELYSGAKPWWPTVYVEQVPLAADVPAPYNAALFDFAHDLVETLVTVLPSHNLAGDQSEFGATVGRGVTDHMLDDNYPRVLPRIVVSASAGLELDDNLKHYRFPPGVFESDYRWVLPRVAAGKLAPNIEAFRADVLGPDAEPVAFVELLDLLAQPQYRTHASSLQLARTACAAANEILAVECASAHVPAEYIPAVSLSGLEVMREGDIIIASPYELGL